MEYSKLIVQCGTALTEGFQPFSITGLREQHCHLQIVPNADKRKCMFFSTSKAIRSPPPWDILGRGGKEIEPVSTCRYLRFLIGLL